MKAPSRFETNVCQISKINNEKHYFTHTSVGKTIHHYYIILKKSAV